MTEKYTRPDFQRMALLTIDVQRDFLDDGSCPVPGTTGVLPEIRTVLDAFRAARLPIVHVVRVYEADGSNVDLCRRDAIESGKVIAQPGTTGMQLARELIQDGWEPLDSAILLSGALQPLGAGEWAMYKSRWGAFFRTRLEDHLRSLGVTTIAFAGCNFPNCPRASIYEASERDFRIVLVDDAVSGIYDRATEELTNIGVTLIASNDLAEVVARSSQFAPASLARDEPGQR